MKKYLHVLLASLFFTGLRGQEVIEIDSGQHLKNTKPWLTTVMTMDKSKIKGWLYKAEEDTLFLLTAGKKKYSVNDKKPDYDERNLKIMADQIQKIYLEKKKANLKGILIGLGAGAITGAIIGYSQGDDPPGSLPRDLFDPPMKAEEKALYSGISGGVLGAFAGYIIAKLARKKFIIGGKKQAFRNSHSELLKRSLAY